MTQEEARSREEPVGRRPGAASRRRTGPGAGSVEAGGCGVVAGGDSPSSDALDALPTGIPPGTRLLALGSRAIGPVSPRLAGRLAFRLWFRTVRSPDPDGAAGLLAGARRVRLEVGGSPFPTYVWGDGPAVLLVHGWSSHAAHMTGFVPRLRDAGFGVVALDAPAHGRAPGRRTDIYEFRDALLAVGDRHGPFRGLVAHSLGSLAALVASASGLEAVRTVLLSPGIRLDTLLDTFAGRIGLAPAVRSDLGRRVRSFVEREPRRVLEDAPTVPTLVVHDRDDRDVPWEEGAWLADRLPDARLRSTRGLGHRRLLQDPDVLEAAVRFLEQEDAGSGPPGPERRDRRPEAQERRRDPRA